jgi:hypothetical protein
MSSAAYAMPEPAVTGAQRPRILHVSEFAQSTGPEAIALARMAGLIADPWQEFVTERALAEMPDGRWAHKRVGLELPRQNGKGGVIEIRELAGLFLLGERLIIHSAHEFATAEQALERMAALLEDCPRLWSDVATVKRSHGQEGVYLKDGRSLRYKTRTKGGGRGFTADCVILDEAMHLPEQMHGALYPTLRALPNPQVWYCGSAVDQESMEHGVVFARVRDQAVKGTGKRLAYFGWSPDFERPSDIPDSAFRDPAVWAQANPAMGIRIDAEYMEQELDAMDRRTFAVELLGVGDWPKVDAEQDGAVISVRAWMGLFDPSSKRDGPPVFTFDVSPDRSSACVAVAAKRADGLTHLEVVEHKHGTGWVSDFLAAAVRAKDPAGVFCDEKGPAASLIPELETAGVFVETINGSEYGDACETFFDAVEQRTVRHLGTSETVNALKGATKRKLGESWAWDRAKASVDITPLVSQTIGRWALENRVSSSLPVAVWG